MIQAYHSITSHSSSSHAISKSEFVMRPFGLASARTSSFTSFGHSTQNTVGTHAFVCPTMTPPTPFSDASLIPTNRGTPDNSSLHNVGNNVDSLNSVRLSCSAVISGLFRCKNTNGGSFQKNPFMGERRPFPPGIEMNAYLSLAVTDRNSANRMPAE